MARHEHRDSATGKYAAKSEPAEERSQHRKKPEVEFSSSLGGDPEKWTEGRWKEDVDADKESGYDDWVDDYGDESNAQHHQQQKSMQPVYQGKFKPYSAAKFRPFNPDNTGRHDNAADNGHETFLLGGR